MSGAVFAMLLAALAQLPIIGQIVLPVLIVQAGATWLHSVTARRRARVLAITKSSPRADAVSRSA